MIICYVCVFMWDYACGKQHTNIDWWRFLFFLWFGLVISTVFLLLGGSLVRCPYLSTTLTQYDHNLKRLLKYNKHSQGLIKASWRCMCVPDIWGTWLVGQGGCICISYSLVYSYICLSEDEFATILVCLFHLLFEVKKKLQ